MIQVASSETTAFPPGFVGPIEFHDFDAIRDASPEWEHSHEQIGRGPVRVRVMGAHTAPMQLGVVFRSPGVLIRGTPPRGTSVLAVKLKGPVLSVQRISWERDRLAVVPRGTEFEIISTTPHTIFELSVDHGRLDEAALARWGQRFSVTTSGPVLRFRDDASRRGLIATWTRWLNWARRQPELLEDPHTAARMEDDVLGAVLSSVEPTLLDPPPRSYRGLAVRTEAFIRQSLEEPIHVEDICTAVGASPRSVHASFQREFGTTPKAYWKALRLSAARKDLERAKRGTRVAEVALKWGFFRFGYFSIDYRAMFGEKPSETLRRAMGRAPHLCPSRNVK